MKASTRPVATPVVNMWDTLADLGFVPHDQVLPGGENSTQ